MTRNYYLDYLLQEDSLLLQKKANHQFIHDDYEEFADLLTLTQPTFVKDLQEKLCQSLINKQSSSMILIGDQYEARRIVLSNLQSIISASNFSLNPLDIKQHVILIDGETIHSDQDAFLTLSNQCLLRQQSLFSSNSDKNVTALLEDLESAFHQSRVNDFPTIIIIDSFHTFTRYKRQTFIYTLLDYIHKSELLFMVIGLTHQVDIYMKLEKRVLSRLNSQYYYLKQYSVEQLASYFLVKLLLATPSPHSDETSSNNDDEDKRRYRQQFNYELSQVFGVFLLTPKKTSSSPSASTRSEDIRFLHTLENKHDCSFQSSYHIELSQPGKAFPLLEKLLDWGKSLQYFDGIIHRITLSISEDDPYVTLQLLQSIVEAQEKPTLPELLTPLSIYEKQIYAVIGRIQCQQIGNHHDQPSTSTTASSNISSHYNNTLPVDGKKEITVQQVLQDLDRLTGGALTNKTITVEMIIHVLVQLSQYGLIHLWSSGGVGGLGGTRNQHLQSSAKFGDVRQFVDGRTIITACHTQYEITAAFKVSSRIDPLFAWKESNTTSEPTTIVIAEKFRRAVLEPLKPILLDKLS